jgi:hypothetical protein
MARLKKSSVYSLAIEGRYPEEIGQKKRGPEDRPPALDGF